MAPRHPISVVVAKQQAMTMTTSTTTTISMPSYDDVNDRKYNSAAASSSCFMAVPGTDATTAVATTTKTSTPNNHRNISHEVTPGTSQQQQQQKVSQNRQTQLHQQQPRSSPPPPTVLTTKTVMCRPANDNINPKHHVRRSSSSFPVNATNNSTNNNNISNADVWSSSAAAGVVRPVSAKHLWNQHKRRREQETTRPLCVGSNPKFPLPSNGIVELAGPAGSGKSQLAMSICADCVASNNKSKAVYIFLGGSGRRLQQTMAYRLNAMLRARWHVLIQRKRRQQQQQQMGAAHTANPGTNDPASTTRKNNNNNTDELNQEDVIHDCMTRVHLRWIRNSDELMELLEFGLQQFLRQHPTTKVVVMDGIANLFRIHEDLAFVSSSMALNPWHNRAVTFFQISRMCRKTSSDFHVPFVVTNEATSRICQVQKATSSSRYGSNDDETCSVLEPALGLAWSQCVDCRFFVKRGQRRCIPKPVIRRHVQQPEDQPLWPTDHDEVLIRILQCVKAPHISTSDHGSYEFWIDQRGAVPFRIIESKLKN